MLKVNVSASTTDDVGEKVSRGARRAIQNAGDAGFAVSQDEAPVDEGTLLQSGIPPEWVGGALVWGYSAEHARFVEEGTAAHYPPIEPLRAWARRVLGDADAAYAIQEQIGQRGTRPQPYVQPGVDEMVRSLRSQGLSSNIDDEL